MAVEEQLKSLNQKLQLLLKQYQQLQKENAALKKEMEGQRLLVKEKNEQLQQLQEKIDVAKLNSSSISPEEKKLLEKRINGYLTEIEKCLVLLNS
ncbi:MAG TPA: hypothetical protein VG738_23425 [Chitinophagaceae bacterium]|nr:hypothetical protein [Chitinophagaceae bacterium]